MASDRWNPQQYERFKAERAQPFFDLLALLRPGKPQPRVIDLGCGTGELTRVLHQRLAAGETLGIDSSPAMLARSRERSESNLRFEQLDVSADWGGGWDLIFSNAALQWLPDHPTLFAEIRRRLAPAGQLAVQMPANGDHPSHRIAHQIARQSPYREALAGYARDPTILSPERYALLLHQLGFGEQHVRLQVYGHVLANTDEVVEWTRGTLLTDYQRRLPSELFERYLAEYRTRVVAELGQHRPFFYPFKRLLLWARQAQGAEL